jgi:glycosyltransferase involved in cell wall biosynthesis
MPKLLIATGIFHPEAGGPATYLYHLLPQLQAHGYEVQVISYGTPSTADTAYPYPVTRIPREQPLPRRMAQYARAARPLMAWADQVYLHTLMLPLARLPWEPRKPRVVKIVGDQAWERSIRRGWVPPTTDIDRFQSSRYRHPWVRVSQWLRRWEVRQMDGVIVPSQYLQTLVRGWGQPSSRIEVVYNALPPTHEAVAIPQAEARQQLGLAAKQPILLTVARLVPWKGIDDFILALAAVPELHLIVAGDGAYRADFEQFAHERGVGNRVTFLGRIPRERVALYMRAADYVGLYSGYEGLSHVIIESLSAGTPVIASDKGGNPEIVQDGVNGLLVPYNDPHALASALVTAFQPGQRDQLAAQTRRGLERFDYDRMVLHTVGALQKLMTT